MGREIERKFLVSGAFREDSERSVRLTQGYLSTDPERTVRVRLSDDIGILTIKGISSADGAARHEWEYAIPAAEARELLQIVLPGVIDKIRYIVPYRGFRYEVDVFQGENEGLIVAELELSDPSVSFEKPAWLGVEVTGDPRYYNTSLSQHPYKSW